MSPREPPKTPPVEERGLGRDDVNEDEHTRPGIPRSDQQPNQGQQPLDPPQSSGLPARAPSSQIIPPSHGNPDLDPAGMTPRQHIDPRQPNPLVPQGMLFDPRQLLDYQRGHDPQHPNINVPPGARFDPFGPPDPSQVGPGMGPNPDLRFANPDPDHFQPPGVPQIRGKTLKGPWPPGSWMGPRGPPPPGGLGGSPFI